MTAETARENKRNNHLIVSLNWVDVITLSGMIVASCSLAAIIAGNFSLALGLLYLAVLLDAFDGILARKYNLQRDFGRFLDGFVDVFDYLIVPALFLYRWGFDAWYQGVILIIFMMCGITRLAVFNEVGNIENDEGELSYWGAPVFWSALALGPLYMLSWVVGQSISAMVLIAIVPAFSIAMLHNGRYKKFKNTKFILVVLLGMSAVFFLQALLTSEVSVIEVRSLTKHAVVALVSILPIVIGGSLHMLAVSKSIAHGLASRPINTGLFGVNKTWRGVVIMPAACIVGFYCIATISALLIGRPVFPFTEYSAVTLGFVTGLAYIIGELPNSYLKRRKGAVPGELPEKNRGLFLVLDQIDSVAAVVLVYLLIFDYSIITCVLIGLMSVPMTYFVKVVLFYSGLKKTAR
ncbi:MAG: CDP-alcohol phosphatidyltransferase family protein [Methylococcaceae bacterium]